MARFRTTTSKGNTYLQYVTSYRNQKGQPATRVLANIANITHLSEEQIEQLTLSFIRAIGLEGKFKMNAFKAGKAYHYGTVLPVIALWRQLGLEIIIDKAISKKVEIAVSRIALIQVANRFSDPGSKLACHRWYDRSVFRWMAERFSGKAFVDFPEDQKEKLHTYYRALDYLCDAKEEIEKELYFYFRGYGIDNSLVLYDITSTYFEGDHSEIGVPGYSRDKRPDTDQVLVGVVMSGDGIPIAHHLFEGNRLDKTTVKEVIRDLRERFGICRAIFVGDRGMVTMENIEDIKAEDYNYIVGLQKRNRRLIKHLLKIVYRDPDRRIQEFGYSDLSPSLQREYSEGVRFVACYNPEVARLNHATRNRHMDTFEEMVQLTQKEGKLNRIKEVHYQLKTFLSKDRMTKLYSLRIENKEDETGEDDEEHYVLKVQKRSDMVRLEERLDGRYFIQTEVSKGQMDKEVIESSYKMLQRVERAFRYIKDEFEIQPTFVRKESRIRGHVMICYLALLIETLLDRKLKEIYPEAYDKKRGKSLLHFHGDGNDPLTLMTLMEELDTVRLIPLKYASKEKNGDKLTFITTSIENNVRKVLSALGVKNASSPQRLYFHQRKRKESEAQLVLNLDMEFSI